MTTTEERRIQYAAYVKLTTDAGRAPLAYNAWVRATESYG